MYMCIEFVKLSDSFFVYSYPKIYLLFFFKSMLPSFSEDFLNLYVRARYIRILSFSVLPKAIIFVENMKNQTYFLIQFFVQSSNL